LLKDLAYDATEIVMREKSPFGRRPPQITPPESAKGEYEGFLQRKVKAAREDRFEGRSRTQADVELEFAARRQELLRKTS
jgi:hypothetical protein